MKEKMASEHQETLNQSEMAHPGLASLEIRTLKEMITAISSKMNITVPVSPHVAPGSPSPPPPICMEEGMTGLDAKKQTAEVKDVLDLLRGNAAEIKTLKEMVTAISNKMNIPVRVSPQVAPDSPLPPPPLPPPICNGGGGNGKGGNGD
ncbi:hypothetical protein LOK49_LG01G01673 [Camellia lanceoleosa]|uniref:Uncharacterized protein n=1 Tax=Camellia lanceoleosa TaxID=1840588 RepID=A0ACC0IW12_9ERIC|nr:hypothetical protein LOK49_LG01G01673 [Camellia lanceoleosa]